MEPQRRKFNLVDLMVLVAATAVGIAWSRAFYFDFINTLPQLPTWISLEYYLIMAHPCFAMWAAALFLLGLRPPRPKHRRLFRQPGYIACAVASFSIVVHGCLTLVASAIGVFAIWFTASWPSRSPGAGMFNWFTYLTFSLTTGSVALLGAWSALIIARMWRPVPTWLDRAGRALAICWLGFFAVETLVSQIRGF